MMSKFIFIEAHAGGRVRMTYFVLVMYNPGYTGLGLKALRKKNSYKFMLFTDNLFIANLLKHLRSCQFTS